MRNLKDLTYGIVGLGIMGGSIAKAIRENIFFFLLIYLKKLCFHFILKKNFQNGN